jgi:rhodanese-related sulfurtransferase
MRQILIALCFLTGLAAAEGQFPDISHEELLKVIASKSAVIIDVNGSDSYTTSHVDGALDYEAVKGDFAAVLPANKDALVIAYCGGPACGAWKSAAVAAAKLGYTNVKHYSLGISGWDERKAK